MRSLSPRLALATLAAAATFATAPFASAQAGGAAADVLFKDGKQLFEQKRYAEACPKFAESYRLDPATGALLALASCHEAEGKLASAWSEYNEVVTRARRDNQADRAEAAKQRAAALEPRLGRLTIQLAPGVGDTPGLVVKRGPLTLGAGSLGTALPTDRGEHVVEASAPGFVTFTARVNVADGGQQVLTVPKLVPTAGAAPAPAPVPVAPPAAPAPAATPAPAPAPALATSPAPAPARAPAAKTGGSPLGVLGVVALIGGAGAVGAGSFFGYRAMSRNNDSNSNNHCVNDVCDPQGTTLRREALDAGSTSTLLFAVGGALIVGGVVLLVVGSSSPKAAASPAHVSLLSPPSPAGGAR